VESGGVNVAFQNESRKYQISWSLNMAIDENRIENKVRAMTPEQLQIRLEALNDKLGITSPHSVTERDPAPPTQNLEELLERDYIKKFLGF